MVRLLKEEDGSFDRNIWAPPSPEGSTTNAALCPGDKKVSRSLGSGDVDICEVKPSEAGFLYPGETHCILDSGGFCIDCETEYVAMAGKHGTSGSLTPTSVFACKNSSSFGGEPWSYSQTWGNIVFIISNIS